MARDYAREYGAAQRRAHERGFAGVSEQRRLPRLPRNLAQHRTLPEEARLTRTAASAAIERSRETGLPLDVTGAIEGVSVAAIRSASPRSVCSRVVRALVSATIRFLLPSVAS